MMDSDAFPSFDDDSLFEIDDTTSTARVARIEAARAAASTYSAKLEEPAVSLFPSSSLYPLQRIDSC